MQYARIPNWQSSCSAKFLSIFQDMLTGGVTLMVLGRLQKAQTRPGSTTLNASNPQNPTKRE